MDDWILSNYRMKSLGEQTFHFHSHAQYEIYYFHAGDCKYLIHNRIFNLEPRGYYYHGWLNSRANPY